MRERSIKKDIKIKIVIEIKRNLVFHAVKLRIPRFSDDFLPSSGSLSYKPSNVSLAISSMQFFPSRACHGSGDPDYVRILISCLLIVIRVCEILFFFLFFKCTLDFLYSSIAFVKL